MTWGFDLRLLYKEAKLEEGDPLIAPFTEQEARQTVCGMNAASAPGPDGLGPSFYAATWETSKQAVMEFLHAFHFGPVDLECINRVVIVLIPKTAPAVTLNPFRPAGLLIELPG